MRELLHQIERAVRERGWLARQASMEAVGSPELITNMRRGRVPLACPVIFGPAET